MCEGDGGCGRGDFDELDLVFVVRSTVGEGDGGLLLIDGCWVVVVWCCCGGIVVG